MWSGQVSSLGTEAASWLSRLCLPETWRPALGRVWDKETGLVPQDVYEDCAEFWEDGALEDADMEAARGLCRGQGIGLYDHSLRIKAGKTKGLKSGTFS